MPYTFTSTFESTNEAILGLAEASSTISELMNIERYDKLDDYTRITVIQNLASEIIENPPDVNNESYPQVPSFSVNAYNFFFRSDKNIGFGINYDRETNMWVATISLYLSSRLFKTNPCAKFLQQHSDIWELMPYVPKKNRKKVAENNTIDNVDNSETDEQIEE